MEVTPQILLILHLPPPIHGAAMVGTYIRDSKLINENFDCDYINLSTAGSLEDIGKGRFVKGFRLLRIQFKVLTSLLFKKYDLCYVTLTSKGPGFYKDFLIVLILKMFGKKIIYHFHNKGVESNRHKKMNDSIYRFVFRNSKTILLSPLLYKDVEYYVKREDVFFCPNGVPEESEANHLMPKNNGICKILFLSNMMQEKGVYVLLEACKKLNEKQIPFECHFVGNWSDIPEAIFREKVKDFDLLKEIFIHGKKYGEDKFYFFKDSDVFVFPTYYECFGLVLLEAMQFGLPIISTYEGGIPDIVLEGETGYLVGQKDSDALMERLESLIKDKSLREQMGNAGKKRYHEFFTMEKFEEKFSEVLHNAIKK